jgi:hypothetical protein
MFNIFFFPENRAFCDMLWKDFVKAGRPQITIWRMRIACWIPKATDTHSEYVILVAFPLQQWLHERASVLRYTFIGCIVTHYIFTLLHIDSIVKYTVEVNYIRDLTGL